MARKRTELDTPRLMALMGQGWTAQAIADDLNASGGKVSRATVDSRMRELRGPVATPRASGPSPLTGPPPVVPEPPESDELPTEEDIEAAAEQGAPAILQTLERIVRLGRNAETLGNLAVVGRLLALELQARDLLRRLTPPEKPDPNDSPDMGALGKTVEERFLAMVDMVLGE